MHGGVVDCGLGRVLPKDPIESAPFDLLFDELVQEKLVVVSRPDHPLARRRRIDPDELTGCEWITPAMGSTAHTICASALQILGSTAPRPAVECDASYGTIIAYIKRFGFLGLLPKTIASLEVSSGGLNIVKVPMQMKLPPIVFIWRRDRSSNPAVARIHEIVSATVKRRRRHGASGW